MLYARSKEILSHGSFNLRKFTTNAAALQTLVDVEEATHKQVNPCGVAQADESYVEATLPTGPNKHPEEQKVLGNVSLDQLSFRFDAMTDSGIPVRPTKRMVISSIGRIYDPLGFLAPVTIRLKVLMQELCKNKFGWDQALDGDLLRKWTGAVERGTTDHATEVLPPRSKNCCVPCGRRRRPFVSKTPLKLVTIPRLELLSAVCLARLISNVTETLSGRLKLAEPRCFTDSQVALFWIIGTGKDWKPFVQNRVDEIRKLTLTESWSHIVLERRTLPTFPQEG